MADLYLAIISIYYIQKWPMTLNLTNYISAALYTKAEIISCKWRCANAVQVQAHGYQMVTFFQ